MKHLLALPVLLVLSACATQPAKVPELQPARLPALKLEGLSPPAVDLAVNVTRDANLQKGNTEAVKDVIRNAVLSSLERGGTPVDPKSTNKLVFTVQNCPDSNINDECVAIRAELGTPRFRAGVTGQGSHGLAKNGSSALPGVGNIDYAYEIALAGAIEALPSQVKKFNTRK